MRLKNPGSPEVTSSKITQQALQLCKHSVKTAQRIHEIKNCCDFSKKSTHFSSWNGHWGGQIMSCTYDFLCSKNKHGQKFKAVLY
jgi:hypothetical protein